MTLHSSPTNCILLSGAISRPGSVRQSAQGSHYLTFAIGFPEQQRNLRTGNIETRTSYIDCIMYGARTAEYSGELPKGRKVTIQGRLHWDCYIDDRHGDNSKFVVRVDRLFWSSDILTGNQTALPRAQAVSCFGAVTF